MSGDSVEMNRSQLERKDRAQLVEIAGAMGGKVPSRARKADIVEIIVGLAGGGEARAPKAKADGGQLPLPVGNESSASGAAGGRSTARRSGGKTSEGDGKAAESSKKSDEPAASENAKRDRSEDGSSAGSDDAETNQHKGGKEGKASESDKPGQRDRSGRGSKSDHDGKKDHDGKSDHDGKKDHDGKGDDAEKSGASDKGDHSDKAERAGGQADGDGSSGDGDRARNQDRSNKGRDGQNRGQGGGGQGGQGQGGQNRGQDGGGQNRGGDDEDGQGRNRRRRRRGRDGDGDGQNRGQGGQNQGGNQGGGNQQWDGELVDIAGFLDLRDEGYGFMRVKGYTPSREDIYVPAKLVRQYGLRKGDHVSGAYRPQMRNEKNPALQRVDEVHEMDPEKAKRRPRFEDLTPLFPDVKLKLEWPEHPQNMTARIIDLISPVGKGQRGLIVSPPKAGKTTVMKTIAQCIEANNPDVHVIVLLVDERPEEVTDMRRSVKGEVIGSTFDRPADEHTHVAEMTIERAKRLVEVGQDVVIILDGITRLARAYNLAAPATGRIMSGGIDTGALYPPKKFFGAARNVEEGGSLTILATALVDTGSAMDNVIFEEFKGTGNMELRLDRRSAERRIYPAIDVDGSSTRHEELLFDRMQLNVVWKLRRVLSGLSADGNPSAALELLIDRMRSFPTNDMFLSEIQKAPGGV